jgi:hypothetical protein
MPAFPHLVIFLALFWWDLDCTYEPLSAPKFFFSIPFKIRHVDRKNLVALGRNTPIVSTSAAPLFSGDLSLLCSRRNAQR